MYPLLSDANSEVIRRFGIFNHNMPEGDRFYGVPFPGMYLLDSTGRVQAKSFLVDHTTRPTAAGFLLQHRGIAPTDGRLELQTEDVRMVLQLAPAISRPGQSVRLRAEVQVQPGVHIYGPAPSENYLPTTLHLNSAEVLLQHDLRFPTPELLVLEGTDESVPVYTGTVVVEGELVLKPFIPAGNYQMQGVLRYQACTDSECYLPEELAFELPLRVEPTVARAEG
jgi:DsbC/DsbD-like thiol-disulfide interchange protein